MLGYAALMARSRYRVYHLLAGWRLRRDVMRRLWNYAAPGGLQMLVECGSFTLFITLVGGLGKLPQAATMLAFNVNSVAWVPMMGVGLAVSTLVGQQLGANRPELAARAAWTAFVLAMIFMCTMSLFYLFKPDWFLMGHARGMDPATFAPLRNWIVVLLRFVAAYCIFDALNVVFMQRHSRRGRHAIRLLDGARHIVRPVVPRVDWHPSLGSGPALVLVVDYLLGLIGRLHLPGPIPTR